MIYDDIEVGSGKQPKHLRRSKASGTSITSRAGRT
jgi:hypothetical protein